MDIHQFPFPATLEDVPSDELWREVCYAEFFAYFPAEGLFYSLSICYVASACCIPLAGLYIFPYWSVLKEQIAMGIEDMKVNYRM